jgi:hypothetical protein
MRRVDAPTVPETEIELARERKGEHMSPLAHGTTTQSTEEGNKSPRIDCSRKNPGTQHMCVRDTYVTVQELSAIELGLDSNSKFEYFLGIATELQSFSPTD